MQRSPAYDHPKSLKQYITVYRHRLAARPLVAELLAPRALGWGVLGAAGLQAGLVSMGLPGWPCLFRHTLGLPCPGCGLSRAIVALLHGDWNLALAYHALALPVLLFLLLLIGTSLLPEPARQRLIARVTGLERRLGLGYVGLSLMLGYWLVRLIFFHSTYLSLING